MAKKPHRVQFYEGLADKLVVLEGARDVQVFDDKVHGFGLRKYKATKDEDTGKWRSIATYFVKYNVGKQQRRYKLGTVVRGNLDQMRSLASIVLAKARLGTDLVAENRAKAAKDAVPKLSELVAPYLAARQEQDEECGLRRLRAASLKEVKRYLEVSWQPLHKLRLDEITPKHVKDTLRDIAAASGKPSADRARATLSTFFVWAVHHEHIAANPTLNIKDKARSRRMRKLSEQELLQIWQACGTDNYGAIVKLCLLTGSRREEIGGLQWPEIDMAQCWIELPEERCKNHRRHLIPLSEPALAIIEGMPRKEGDYVFGRHGAGGFVGWSKGKTQLDKRIAAARRQAGLKPMEPWVLHDLRRALSTRLNELGICEPHVVEAILNHVSGHRAGVAGTYNHAQYISQKREALDKWASRINGLISRRPDYVGRHPDAESGDQMAAERRSRELV
jgi:integrase